MIFNRVNFDNHNIHNEVNRQVEQKKWRLEEVKEFIKNHSIYYYQGWDKRCIFLLWVLRFFCCTQMLFLPLEKQQVGKTQIKNNFQMSNVLRTHTKNSGIHFSFLTWMYRYCVDITLAFFIISFRASIEDFTVCRNHHSKLDMTG